MSQVGGRSCRESCERAGLKWSGPGSWELDSDDLCLGYQGTPVLEFWRKRHSVFQAENDKWTCLRRGCVGVVEYFIGQKVGIFGDPTTKCFIGTGNPSLAIANAKAAASALKCPKGTSPHLFGVIFWSEGSVNPITVLNPATGQVDISWPTGVPGRGDHHMDWAYICEDGTVIGANHADNPERGEAMDVLYWDDIESYATAYTGSFNTTVICLTCGSGD